MTLRKLSTLCHQDYDVTCSDWAQSPDFYDTAIYETLVRNLTRAKTGTKKYRAILILIDEGERIWENQYEYSNFKQAK